MRRFIFALAAVAVLAAGCHDKPVDPLKPKVLPQPPVLAML